MSEHEGKAVIVTGGAKGIGRAITLAFGQAGAHVACADIDDAAGAQIDALARDLPGTVRYCHRDVSQ